MFARFVLYFIAFAQFCIVIPHIILYKKNKFTTFRYSTVILGRDYYMFADARDFFFNFNIILFCKRQTPSFLFQEFLIDLAVEILRHILSNHKVLFFTDNMAAADIINKTSSKDKMILMKLVRRLVLASLKCNMHFRAKHIAGKTNTVCDLLSRFSFQEAHQLGPWLSQNPISIPHHLLKLQQVLCCNFHFHFHFHLQLCQPIIECFWCMNISVANSFQGNHFCHLIML